MARRGKAATRQARQRRAQRPSTATTAPRVRPPDEPAAVAESGSTTPATVAPLGASATTTPRSRSDRVWRPEVSSQLSERALAEYHYVGRDLRNIGQAAALMAGLLLLVVIIVRVMGIGPG